MSRFTNSCKLLLIGSTWLLTSVPVYAAPVTIVGDNFDLSYDDAQPDLAIYGVPTYGLGTNVISFNQVGFTAESADGAGLNQTASTIEFTLTRHDNSFNFETLNLFEFGSYTLDGADASVDVTGSMSVQTLTFPAPGSAFVPGPPGIAPFGALTTNDNAAHDWFGGAFANLVTSGENTPNPFGPGIANDFTTYDAIRININNILRAETTVVGGGSSAFIEKLSSSNSVQLGVNGSPASAVPVPAAAWLMISGLLGLFGIARRK